jgi:hypothetical protein
MILRHDHHTGVFMPSNHAKNTTGEINWSLDKTIFLALTPLYPVIKQ